jgi:hypothetical protein
MIDRSKEKLITFARIARSNPGRGKSGVMDPSTIWRMAFVGYKGITLEYESRGHTNSTSQEALERYTQAIRKAKQDARETRLDGRTPARRQRESNKAKEQLKKLMTKGGSQRRTAVARG